MSFIKKLLFTGLALSSACFFAQAAHQNRWGGNPWGGFYGERYSRGYQRAQEMEMYVDLSQKLKQKLDTTADAAERASLMVIIQQLQTEMTLLSQPKTFSQSLGNAILQGFAGNDSGEFEDLKITNATDGLKLGLAVASAQAMSTVVKKYVESTTDRLIGGIWERLIDKILEGGQYINDGLFHGGCSALLPSEVRGLSTMTNKTFTDLNVMLRDGLKDLYRGSDMTVRLAEDQQDTSNRSLGWRILISAYTRQIDYIILLITDRLPYYEETHQVVFYGKEIIQCLTDVKLILADVKNVRELDERLDSNKNLINALKNNIQNLFERLIEFIEPKNYTSASSASQAKNSRGRMNVGRGDMDDYDDHPHAFHG
jgi:hypothetical protein